MPYTSAQGPSGESSFSHDLEMKTPDGVALRATLREPEAPDGHEPLATLVFAHAMFARRSEWERPRGQGLAAIYADRGFRTISFDFRGHGDSTSKPGSSDYDAYVRHDLPTVVSCAKDRGGKVVVIGHSLGGHVALASQGAGFLGADALVVAGANVWHETLEPSRARFAAQRLAAGAISRIVRTAGKFPARALRMGSDDAPPGALSVFLRTPESGAWTSDDGALDYFASLSRVHVPVCAIVSRGDRFICRPTCGERFVSRVRGPKKVLVVERADDGGPAPDHMGLVTSLACRSQWDEAIAWALAST